MEKFIEYVEGTKVFTEFFANLPTPLNNVYFLILITGIVVLMFLSNIFDSIFAHIRHKQLMKKAEESQSSGNNQMNENVMGFLAAMQYAFMSKQRRQEETVVTIEEQPSNFIEQKENYFEAAMREQRQKDIKKRQLFEENESKRLKAEAIKSELTKEEGILNEG